jgi:DnaA regulatory inactivator Hda
MKSLQKALDFDYRPALGRENFIVAPCNAKAVALIDRWPDWQATVAVITGPKGCGKSHLAQVFRAKSGALLAGPRALSVDSAPALADTRALVLDGLDEPFDERAMFHLLNLLRMRGSFLLMTARTPPARWSLALPDLATRLGEALLVELEPPDDGFLTALLIKLFADRQLHAPPELVNYLVSRLERSCGAMAEAVAALDAASLERQRPLSVALAREMLAKTHMGGHPAAPEAPEHDKL